MKFNDLFMTIVKKDLEQGSIPMLLGEPGIGKSSWVENLAKIMRTKCFTLACNQLADKADLTGARLVPVTDKNGETTYTQVFYPHIVIHEAIEYAKENPREFPILFLDELNRTTPDVTSEALSIPTLRSIGNKKLPDNLRVITAGNDKGNVTALDEASISRFVLYSVTPDVGTFLGLDPNLNIFIKNVLTVHPECIFAKQSYNYNISDSDDSKNNDENEMFIDVALDMGDEMKQITTPRTIMGLSRFLNSCDTREILTMLSETSDTSNGDKSVLKEVIEGYVGLTDFTNYLLKEIADNILTAQTVSSTMQIGKPADYDTLKAQTTQDDLNNMISTLSDKDKSGCLLYAMYEKEDNEVLIKALAHATQTLIGSDMKAMMNFVSNDQLDKENVQAFLTSGSTLSNQLSIILEA